jgi:hypothetical protein
MAAPAAGSEAAADDHAVLGRLASFLAQHAWLAESHTASFFSQRVWCAACRTAAACA